MVVANKVIDVIGDGTIGLLIHEFKHRALQKIAARLHLERAEKHSPLETKGYVTISEMVERFGYKKATVKKALDTISFNLECNFGQGLFKSGKWGNFKYAVPNECGQMSFDIFSVMASCAYEYHDTSYTDLTNFEMYHIRSITTSLCNDSVDYVFVSHMALQDILNTVKYNMFCKIMRESRLPFIQKIGKIDLSPIYLIDVKKIGNPYQVTITFRSEEVSVIEHIDNVDQWYVEFVKGAGEPFPVAIRGILK